jgi:hypothetical protein
MKSEIVPQEMIENRIFLIRGQKVMIDRDLAELFGVKTKNLNTQVKRNFDRFPDEFIFRLNEKEKNDLAANCSHLSAIKYSRHTPIAFTEYGVAMLATLLKSERAVKMSIFIIKAFIALRKHIVLHKELDNKLELLEKRVFKHDSDIRELVRDIRKLTIEKSGNQLKKIGFDVN